jgi:hypothetical protein
MTVARSARMVTFGPKDLRPKPLLAERVFVTVMPIGAPPGWVTARMPSLLFPVATLSAIVMLIPAVLLVPSATMPNAFPAATTRSMFARAEPEPAA